MEIEFLDKNWYVDDSQVGDDIVNYLKSFSKGWCVFWVKSDLTFYMLLNVFRQDLNQIKVNFYEFRCVGFRYKNGIFKQKQLQAISQLLLCEEKYAYTYGAYALKLLKQLIDEKQIKPIKIEAGLRNKLRVAYAGGRNEFISEPKPNMRLFSVDFNTMYLSCLKTKFLTGSINHRATTTVKEPGFYYIKYTNPECDYPILYVRNNFTKQPYFCVGQGEGLFGYEEIELFKKEGGVLREVSYAYTADDYTENFKPFINKISCLGNKKIAKLLANNLYGRLAMKDYTYPVRLATDLDFFLLEKKGLVKRWAGWYDFFVYESLEHTAYANYTDIAAAAAITAKARIKLVKLVNLLKAQAQICLLNTDEVIIASKCLPTLGGDGDVKIKEVTYDIYKTKKQLFENKRHALGGGYTRPYKNIGGMFL